MSLEHPFYYGCHRNKRGVFGWIPLDWENETLLMKEHTSMNVEHTVFAKVELCDVPDDLQELPPAMRKVVCLRAISDLSYKEIGNMLEKNISGKIYFNYFLFLVAIVMIIGGLMLATNRSYYWVYCLLKPRCIQWNPSRGF